MYSSDFYEFYLEFLKNAQPAISINQSINLCEIPYDILHENVYQKHTLAKLVAGTGYRADGTGQPYAQKAYKNCFERSYETYDDQKFPLLKPLFQKWRHVDTIPCSNGTCGFCGKTGLSALFRVTHITHHTWAGVGSTCITRCHMECYNPKLAKYILIKKDNDTTLTIQKKIWEHELIDEKGDKRTIRTGTSLKDFEKFMYGLTTKSKTPNLTRLLRDAFFTSIKRPQLKLHPDDIPLLVSEFQNYFPGLDLFKRFDIVISAKDFYEFG